MLTKIWVRPREAIRELSARRSSYLIVPLFMTYGIVMCLSRVLQRGVSPDHGFSRFQVLGLNVLFGAVYGLCFLFVASYLLSWIGRLLGGSARPGPVRTVLACASVPYVPLLAMLFLLVVLGPGELLIRSAGTPFSVVGGSPWLLGLLTYFVSSGILAIWLCIIGVVGLSEVHGFGIGRSIATYAIVLALFVGAFLGVVSVAVG